MGFFYGALCLASAILILLNLESREPWYPGDHYLERNRRWEEILRASLECQDLRMQLFIEYWFFCSYSLVIVRHSQVCEL